MSYFRRNNPELRHNENPIVGNVNAAHEANNAKSSFGIEMEGYVAWVAEGVEFAKPLPPWPETAGPLIIPREELQQKGVRRAVHAHLAKLLRDKLQLDDTTTTVVPKELAADALGDNLTHLREFRRWTVKADSSLEPVPAELTALWRNGPDRGWASFELCSPALWATDAGLAEVRRACRFLTDEVWVSAPDSTGLHVHWGNGADFIPLESLRRVAALMYAADGLMVQLHPPARRNNDFCYASSLYSRIALGCTVEEAERGMNFLDPAPDPAALGPRPHREDVPGLLSCLLACLLCRRGNTANNRPVVEEGENAGARANANADIPEFFRALLTPDPRRGGFGPRGAEGTYTLNQEMFDELAAGEVVRNRAPTAPRDAVRGLLKCRSTRSVAELMTCPNGPRLSYSFDLYSDYAHDDKRTVESRQAAGSFDADVVCAWAKACYRLCEWATEADFARYFTVVYRCASASNGNPTAYDAYDLLADVGLLHEGRYLRKSLLDTLRKSNANTANNAGNNNGGGNNDNGGQR